MIIRNEKQDDYRPVEEMIKKAFWNLYVPGCNEHYFAHQVRKSEDFIPELDLVLEEDGRIIGQILYVRAKLIADDGTEKEILSFGPFTIHPDYQRKGYGRKLLYHSFSRWKRDTLILRSCFTSIAGQMFCVRMSHRKIPQDFDFVVSFLFLSLACF